MFELRCFNKFNARKLGCESIHIRMEVSKISGDFHAPVKKAK